MLRQIKRNILKNKIGSNKISKVWRDIQIEKFGVKKWMYLYNKCVKKLRWKEIYV